MLQLMLGNQKLSLSAHYMVKKIHDFQNEFGAWYKRKMRLKNRIRKS